MGRKDGAGVGGGRQANLLTPIAALREGSWGEALN